jgi:site-specific DNA recombinase
VKRSDSGALLLGKLFDDRGNGMSPSFSVKNGVRYRFYISSALLRGRKDAAGSVARVSAQEVESALEAALRERMLNLGQLATTEAVLEQIERAVLTDQSLEVTARISGRSDSQTFVLPWMAKEKAAVFSSHLVPVGKPNQKLLQAVVRAHTWLRELSDGTHTSIESLAASAKLHPKIIRQALRFAFLAPEITESILEGSQSADVLLATIPFTLPLRWLDQRRVMAIADEIR